MVVNVLNTVSNPLSNYMRPGTPPVSYVASKSSSSKSSDSGWSSTVKSLIEEGTDTLTIINTDTGEIVRQGQVSDEPDLPSVSGGGQVPDKTGWSYRGGGGGGNNGGGQVTVATSTLTGLPSEKYSTADPNKLTIEAKFNGLTTLPGGQLIDRIKTVSIPGKQFYEFQAQKYPEQPRNLASEVGTGQTDFVMRAFNAPLTNQTKAPFK